MALSDVARKNMVDCQLRTNQVTDERLLEVLSTIPRENLVPRHMKDMAYVDEDIALGNGRFLQDPVVLARLIQVAKIQPTDVILDVGCGTGYSTAVLGELSDTVVGLEQDKKLADKADKAINDLDICNTAVIKGDLKLGYPEQAPYDVIFINGSVPFVPECFFDQLCDGGRLISVISDNGHMGVATLFEKQGDKISETQLFDAATPLLCVFKQEEGFSF